MPQEEKECNTYATGSMSVGWSTYINLEEFHTLSPDLLSNLFSGPETDDSSTRPVCRAEDGPALESSLRLLGLSHRLKMLHGEHFLRAPAVDTRAQCCYATNRSITY